MEIQNAMCFNSVEQFLIKLFAVVLVQNDICILTAGHTEKITDILDEII